MAAASVTTKNLVWGTADAPTMATVDGTDGAFITPGASESTVIILAAATAGATVTIHKADGFLGVASDLEISLSSGATKYVCVETAKYASLGGANSGKIKVTYTSTGSPTVSAGAMTLPR